MAELTPVPPAFPVVEILGRKYVLKFDFLAKYQMSVLGIKNADFRAFRRPENPQDMDPTVTALSMKLFSCAAANNFIDVDNPGAPAQIPGPEYWAAVIPEDKFGEVVTATIQAMLKAAPPAAAPALADSTGARTQ